MARPLKPVRTPALKGAEMKLRRAQEHMTLVNSEFLRWGKQHPEPVLMGFRDNPDPNYLPMVVTSVENPDELAPLIGDAVHNFRCVLDHIAWQLVAHGRKPQRLKTKAAHSIQFPLVVGPTDKGKPPADHFRDSLGQLLPGLRSVHKTIVRSHQPYTRGQLAEQHPLALLKSLDNIDKHRQLHPGLLAPTKVGFEVIHTPEGCEVKGFRPGPDLGKPFHVGAELGGYVVADKAACEELEVQPSSKVKVAFQAGLGGNPKPFKVFDVLTWIANEVADVLAEVDAVL